MKRPLRNNFSSLSIEPREGLEILICIIALSLAVLIAINMHMETDLLSNPSLFFLFLIVFIFTIGIGFVLHELSHKAVAIAYGARSRFMMWPQGLLLMFITSLFGFVFAAPGAVYIFAKQITIKENGIISAAGPLMNIFISLVFLFFYKLSPAKAFFPLNIWMFGAYINALLAAFNMLPIFPLDGSKIISWNFPVWLLMLFISGWLMLAFGGALVP